MQSKWKWDEMRTVKFDLYDKNKGVVTCDDPSLIGLIREKLSVKDKNARFIKAHSPYASDRIYCITKSGKFDIGLFMTVKKCFESENIPVEFKYSDKFIQACLPRFQYYLDELSQMQLNPYDYQEASVKNMLKFGRGVILIGTGGGKTFIMSLLSKTIKDHEPDKRFLIIVPTIQLVEQTYDDFLDYGFNSNSISKWSGNNKFQDSEILIASSSILQSKSSDLSFLNKIDVLMIDEVHILKKDNLINKIIDQIPTNNRFGFTGTLPEDIQDQWNIYGKIGPVLYKKASDSLRNDKVISEAKINIIKIQYNHETLTELHNKLSTSARKYEVELDFMVKNEFRNNLIADAARVSRGNTLIMVDRIEHGEILESALNIQKKKKVYFIKGDVKVDKREEVREIMENNSNIICIAISKIFSTGINIKNIHNIIFATPGKAKVKLIQSIGRGLRLHASKPILNVLDFADDLHYSNRHLIKRVSLYGVEKLKYDIGIVKEPKRTKN